MSIERALIYTWSLYGVHTNDAYTFFTFNNSLAAWAPTIVGEDAIRSIAAAIFSLGAEEVLVIGHTECGMAGSDPDKLRNAMIERGIPQEEIDKIDLKSWIGGFEDEEENVIDTVEKIRNHPLIPDVPIHGLMMDIVTGKLDVVVDDR